MLQKRILCLAAIALVAAIAPTMPTPAYAATLYLADADDPAVTTLAKDRGISIAEARSRVGLQEPAIQMADELRTLLGEGFGGLWVDVADGGRVKIGVVGTAPAAAAQSSIQKWGLTAVTDTVQLRHSYAQLERDSAWLASLVTAANRDTEAELSFATQVDRNRLVLRTPAGRSLTAAQQSTVEAAKAHLGSRLVLETWSGSIQRQGCEWNLDGFNCDAPMRGGVRTYINQDVPQCSTAFNAASISDHKWYVLTAGHCAGIGTEMRAFQPTTDLHHVIGNVHNRVYDNFDDFAIIKINRAGSDGWKPKNWVYVHSTADTVLDPDYTITDVSTSPVGTRVCLSGATSGTDCGDVVELNWNGPAGFARATYCSASGDSGGAIYSNHKARGIHIGRLSQNACGDRLFQGVIEAANILNVYVFTG